MRMGEGILDGPGWRRPGLDGFAFGDRRDAYSKGDPAATKKRAIILMCIKAARRRRGP
jgi:hypothetical protein